jgi:hypothetical protein
MFGLKGSFIMYSSSSLIVVILSRRMSWQGMFYEWGGVDRPYTRIISARAEKKRPLGTPRHSWLDNIKIDLGEISWNGINWIVLAQDRDK